MSNLKNGWDFLNKTDCLDYIESDGDIANYRECPYGPASDYVCTPGWTHEGCCPCCPPVWDGFLCWPPAPLNTIVEQPCPGNIPQLNHKSKILYDVFTSYYMVQICLTCHSASLTAKIKIELRGKIK